MNMQTSVDIVIVGQVMHLMLWNIQQLELLCELLTSSSVPRCMSAMELCS